MGWDDWLPCAHAPLLHAWGVPASLDAFEPVGLAAESFTINKHAWHIRVMNLW
jgi:hypothetical protein